MRLAWSRRLEFGLLYRTISVVCLTFLVAVACFSHWWGGYSFGPRLHAAILGLLTVLMIPVFHQLPTHRTARIPIMIFIAVAFVWGAAVHGMECAATTSITGTPVPRMSTGIQNASGIGLIPNSCANRRHQNPKFSGDLMDLSTAAKLVGLARRTDGSVSVWNGQTVVQEKALRVAFRLSYARYECIDQPKST